jgi:hypothetical protein
MPALIMTLLAALAIIAVLVCAGPAAAFGNYAHGNATACDSCHPISEAVPPTVADCANCHTGFKVPTSSYTCYTCHAPGEDVQAIKTGAPTACTDTCHLSNGTTHTHNPHPDRGTCTTAGCHNVTTSSTAANGSPHHIGEVVPQVKKSSLTLSLSGLRSGVLRLRKSVTAKGVLKPFRAATVKITVQRKVSGTWRTATTKSRSANATSGAYSWTYKPTKKGAYRVHTTSAKTTLYTAATSPWRTFTVK